MYESGHPMIQEALEQQEWVPRPEEFYETVETCSPYMGTGPGPVTGER